MTEAVRAQLAAPQSVLHRCKCWLYCPQLEQLIIPALAIIFRMSRVPAHLQQVFGRPMCAVDGCNHAHSTVHVASGMRA